MNARKPSPTSKRSTPADAKGASKKPSTTKPRPATTKTKASSSKKAAPAKAPAKAKAKAPPAKAKAKAKASGKPAPRKDLGAPIAGFFRKQRPPLRVILDQLHALIEAAAPDASSSIKWGMPFYMIGDEIMCALGGHKSHVNLILSGPPGTFSDPGGLLAGDGKTGRHLKLVAGDSVPNEAVRGWLRTAVERARAAATTIARR